MFALIILINHYGISLCTFNEHANLYMFDTWQIDTLFVYSMKSGGDSAISISQLHDIEENVWSPQYGLKGKVMQQKKRIIFLIL